MRVLFDTNILIHRETAFVRLNNIGDLFNWIDRLGFEKCIHPISQSEIENHGDQRIRDSFRTKLRSYHLIMPSADLHRSVADVGNQIDTNINDQNDTALLNEVFIDRIDYLITEDRKMRQKATKLGISDRVFSIDAFLEKVIAENPDQVDYSVLSVRKSKFANVPLDDPFFDSFRQEYAQFDRWFIRKAEETCYICSHDNSIVAFLFLKVEDERENYHDISPAFTPKRRLKIGTFKVTLNGFKIGERFLKIIFDNAIHQNAHEIYVTIFPNTIEQQRLISLIEEFGFDFHGEKVNEYGNERVYTRSMRGPYLLDHPGKHYPFVLRNPRTFLVPIYPDYHTDLLPDSILNNESPDEFIEQEPHRNAIRKVYVSRSIERDIRPSDVIIFYRTGGYHRSVVTTIGVVESVHNGIETEADFVSLCRKRSVFSDAELKLHWNYTSNNRPFVVKFLCAYSFPQRPNMATLIENGVIRDVASAPRGFTPISQIQFKTILRLSRTDPRIIVN